MGVYGGVAGVCADVVCLWGGYERWVFVSSCGTSPHPGAESSCSLVHPRSPLTRVFTCCIQPLVVPVRRGAPRSGLRTSHLRTRRPRAEVTSEIAPDHLCGLRDSPCHVCKVYRWTPLMVSTVPTRPGVLDTAPPLKNITASPSGSTEQVPTQ